jgi:hypothetical protein
MELPWTIWVELFSLSLSASSASLRSVTSCRVSTAPMIFPSPSFRGAAVRNSQLPCSPSLREKSLRFIGAVGDVRLPALASVIPGHLLFGRLVHNEIRHVGNLQRVRVKPCPALFCNFLPGDADEFLKGGVAVGQGVALSITKVGVGLAWMIWESIFSFSRRACSAVLGFFRLPLQISNPLFHLFVTWLAGHQRHSSVAGGACQIEKTILQEYPNLNTNFTLPIFLTGRQGKFKLALQFASWRGKWQISTRS